MATTSSSAFKPARPAATLDLTKDASISPPANMQKPRPPPPPPASKPRTPSSLPASGAQSTVSSRSLAAAPASPSRGLALPNGGVKSGSDAFNLPRPLSLSSSSSRPIDLPSTSSATPASVPAHPTSTTPTPTPTTATTQPTAAIPFATGAPSTFVPRRLETRLASSASASPAPGGFHLPQNGFAAYAQPPSSSANSAKLPSTSTSSPRPTFATQSGAGHSTAPPTSISPAQLSRQGQPQALGRIPIISSSNARLPSYPQQPHGASGHPYGGIPPIPSANDYIRLQAAAAKQQQDLMAQAQAQMYARAQAQAQKKKAANGGNGFMSQQVLGMDAGESSATSKGKGKEVIDLTEVDEDSDDDVIVDETPVCIGQLTSLALILYPVAEIQPPEPPPLPADADPNTPRPPPPPQSPLPVHIFRGEPNHKGDETLRISTPRTHEIFGVVEGRVANVVASLFGDGYVGTGVTKGGNGVLWCEASVTRRGEKNPMMLPLNLLLFARPFDVPMISSRLEQNTIYLEHPPTYNPALHNGARYANPHNPAAGVAADRRRAHLYQVRAPVKAVDMARQQVDDVFASLKSGPDLGEQEPDPLVATPLYPHQKQALSFLLDREQLVDVPTHVNPGEPTVISLWRQKIDTYGRPVGWMNMASEMEIAGSAPPPQSRGSILADDMGLGKTIVVISLVAATLAEARTWALLPPEIDTVEKRFDKLREKKKKPDLNDFQSGIYGFQSGGSGGGGGASSGKPLSKKARAKADREQKKEDVLTSRFDKLVTRSRATLIVCPLSTVQNWESQFEEHVVKAVDVDGGKAYSMSVKSDDSAGDSEEDFKPHSEKGKAREKERQDAAGRQRGAMSLYVYHGNSRTSDPLKLADYDVVVTTFSTLGTEYSRQVRAEEERGGADQVCQEESDGELDVYDNDGNLVLTAPPVGGGKRKRKRKKVEGNGYSPLQQIQWFRVVLDEAHIIKEHTTIQARAACELSASRRTALSGTPLQNSLNDLFSLVRFLRLEPFTDRGIWTQYIGALAKNGNELGVSRLQLIMRHLALRRTKASVDKDGKPILALPPNDQKLVHLTFDQAETAFYHSHHNRYKHDFRKLEETDSVMKNYCSILQELLRLRQICVHMALVRDSEDTGKTGGDGDIIKTIERHGISKPRAIQLLGIMRDSGAAQCAECGHDVISPNPAAAADEMPDEPDKKPAKKSRKLIRSATASAACSDDEAASSTEIKSVVTRCQHLFCRQCFAHKVAPKWPDSLDPEERAICSVCRTEINPALDAVEFGARELERALDAAAEQDAQAELSGKKNKGTRFFEHSTKTKALLADLFPFSQANPASVNFWGGMDEADLDEATRPIGFQPVKGEVVKSVVFSQWTKLLDRVGDTLEQAGIKFGRLDGGMNRDQRTKAMDTFKTDPSCEVLLVSLRAGGVGLNLTVARRVYLMEPFWNPAVENQAVDRIHRLGQTKPVQTVRFVIAKSIEENMLKIQQRKTDLANMSLKQTLSKAEVAKRRLEELRMMFE